MIELVNITKVYGQKPNTVTALNRINLKLQPKELTAIMGPSGSGKTTLLNIIGCLDSATYGEYFLNNRNVVKLDLKAKAQLRNEVFGFVFQSFNLLTDKTVLENVMLPFRYSKVPRREWKPKAMAVLEQLGIAALAARYPDQLSGGQQQRVAIARALVNDPKVILADEPTGNLDSATGKEIITVLKELAEKQGKVVVVVTHDGMVASQAHRLVQMTDGWIIDDSRIDNNSVSFSHPQV